MVRATPYISDGDNARVRKVDTQGIITTIAGNGVPKVAGDGGPATAAALSRPTGLAFDAYGTFTLPVPPVQRTSTHASARLMGVELSQTWSAPARSGTPVTAGRPYRPISTTHRNCLRPQGNLLYSLTRATSASVGWTRTVSSRLLPGVRHSRPRSTQPRRGQRIWRSDTTRFCHWPAAWLSAPWRSAPAPFRPPLSRRRP